MNFFEHQDQARRNTKKLVGLFILAVVTLITVTSVFISAAVYHYSKSNSPHFSQLAQQYPSLPPWLNPEIFMLTAACVLGTVIVGSLFKWMQLSAGGKAVAEAMGGRQILQNTDQPREKKILNIVEEMAIASGLPVPAVFMLDSAAINAFAAGHNHHDAIIGVTQGCVDLLDREQLQGVIAHEFSHILHGDMSLNMRLVGVLHGILAISLIGRLLLHTGRPRHRRFNSRRSNDKGSGIALIGLGLLIIGYIGSFFGSLIKANVSRQREFLADASAVQFTRNPEGIGQALQKIGGFSHGSQLNQANTEEFSHLFFGEVSSFNSWMATHPPLPERITRILPQWGGQYPEVAAPASTEESSSAYNTQAASHFSGESNTRTPTSPPQSAIDSIGSMNTAQLHKAKQLLGDIPRHLKEAAGDAFSARALVYSLLMKDDEGNQSNQWQQLKSGCHPVVFRHTTQLFEEVQQLSTELMLPLFESCLVSLKTLSTAQYQVFKKNVMLLIRADKKVSVFEWCLYRMLINNLEAKRPSSRAIDLIRATSACEDLLSNLCLLGETTPQTAELAFHKAAENLEFKLNYTAQQEPHFQHIDQALQTLRRVKPLQKPQLLKALACAIEHDGQITVAEQELFRAIADNLDCPVPPLPAGRPLY